MDIEINAVHDLALTTLFGWFVLLAVGILMRISANLSEKARGNPFVEPVRQPLMSRSVLMGIGLLCILGAFRGVVHGVHDGHELLSSEILIYAAAYVLGTAAAQIIYRVLLWGFRLALWGQMIGGMLFGPEYAEFIISLLMH